MKDPDCLEEHLAHVDEAAGAYLKLMDPAVYGEAWRDAFDEAQTEVTAALDATSNLTAINTALLESGSHARALRFLLGPPLSQDQFLLACPDWSKASEKTGRPLSPESARAFAEAFELWKDPDRAAQLDDPERRRRAIAATAILIASNSFATRKRMRLAKAQEDAAATVLDKIGFEQISPGLVESAGALKDGQYARATQFVTADGSSQEVDLAVGLSGGRILALECKVSNDRTNSIKRINDVLKKAAGWQTQWGRFVITGALLQGVFSQKEPRRLLDNRVKIFWSHRLDDFRSWICSQSDFPEHG
jgi:hypothetical protein